MRWQATEECAYVKPGRWPAAAGDWSTVPVYELKVSTLYSFQGEWSGAWTWEVCRNGVSLAEGEALSKTTARAAASAVLEQELRKRGEHHGGSRP